jgi:citronellol/citronellal dehydrogenase
MRTPGSSRSSPAGGRASAGRSPASTDARARKVAIAGRRPQPLEAVAAELAEAGVDVLAVPRTDVREPEQVASLVDAVLDRFGRVDVLVNNAGGQFAATPESISPKGWRAVHRLNSTRSGTSPVPWPNAR